MSLNRGLIAAFAASVLMFTLPATALELGWSGGPMSASGDTIRTEGDLVYAYCGGQTDLETFTVNGITFTAVKKTDSIPQSLKPFPFDTSPRMYMDKTGYGTEGVSDEDYGHILDTGWWASERGENTFTLTGLEANHTYLVQMVFRYPHINAIYKVAAPDGTEVRAGSGAFTPDKELWQYGGTLVNVFQASSDKYTFTLNYTHDDKRSFLSAIQLRDVSDEPMVVKPAIGSVSARPHVGRVTISLADVLRGSDAQGAAASSYSVVCALDGGDPETVLEGQTEAKTKFDLEDLEDGEHTAEVSIVNDKGVASEAVSLAFSTEIPLGWTAEPMDAVGDAISLDGDLLFAYSSQKDTEVKGISFKGKSDFYASEFRGSQGFRESQKDVAPPVDKDSAYGTLLSWSFWIQAIEQTLTLYNLEPGEKYLVQLISSNSSRSGKIFAPGSEETFIKPSGDGWIYGGTLIGVFVASAAEMSFKFNVSSGASAVNAIQLRKFKGAPKVIEPSVGTLAAKAKGTTATVTLAGVDMGTDDKGIPATSYSVSYRLDDGDEVLALEDQTGATASFQIGDLTDGEYTCSVTITTSAGKTTEAKSVSFLVNTSIGDFDALKEAIESAAMGDTIEVARGTYYATSKIAVRQKNVTVVATENVVINGEGSEEGTFDVKAEGVTISGIEFENCSNANGYGGAINVNNNYHGFVATNCIFRNCAAKMGGGIGGSCYYGSYGAESSDGIPARGELGVITGCTFVDCASTGASAGDGESGGGAVSGAYWIENTAFEGGLSNYYSPGIYSGFNLMVTNCTFTATGGPGKSSRGMIWMARNNTELCVLDCTFADMSCQPLIGTASGRLLADRCVFENCAGTETKPNDNSGEMQLVYGSGTVRNSLVCRNKNPFALGNQVFENCTIADNVGGLFIKISSGASPVFTNCVWARNTRWEGSGYTSWGGPGLSWHGGDSGAYTKTTFSRDALEGAAAIENQKVLFGQDPTGTTKTLSEALDAKGPRFAAPENGDWTLRMSSPLKDAGVLCDWMAGALDLAGNPRIVDLPDLGCYERIKKGLQLLVR